MASQSTGQIIGTVAGAVIGFFAPGAYVALGASIGGMIGGMIDPPKGPTVVGPRLDDLSFQTSTLGAPLGRAYGTVPILGNVVWLEGDKYNEVITSESQGGKGGPTSTTETAHYYATFAVSLLRVPDATKTVALRRLWIGSNLVYDAGSDNIESVIASNSQSALFTFYSGSDDQQPNTRWQADKGVNSVSGFPGRCYIVIYDLDLEPYSRSLAMAQVKAELVIGATATNSIADVASIYTGDLGDPVYGEAISLLGTQLTSANANYVTRQYSKYDGSNVSIHFGLIEYGVSKNETTVNLQALSFGYANFWPTITQSDEQKSMCVFVQYNAQPQLKIRFITIGGDITSPDWINDSKIIYPIGVVAFDGGEVFTASNNPNGYVTKINEFGLIAGSINQYSINSLGVSETYVFGLYYTPGINNNTTTVYKFDRETLALVATYTDTARGGQGALYVVNDDVFYTAGNQASTGYRVVYKWINGSVVEDFGARFTATGEWHPSLAVFSDSPFYAAMQPDETTEKHIYVSHNVIPSAPARLRDVVTSECGLAGISAGEIDLTALIDSDVRGYRISSAGSIRSSLEMLQAAFPFDVAPSGYKLRFVSRGGASMATIPEADLGATDSGSSLPVLLPSAREMDTQIPYKVSVRYLDQSREYDIGEQYASRPDTASVNERTVELSLVLTGEEAARVADVLNQKDWIERTSFGPFSLPPTWGELEPPDVVTVEHRGQSHTIRLTRAEFLPDGRIECAGVYSSAQSYTSTATAQESLTIGQSLVPLKGSTQGYLLDIPRIRSEQDIFGMSYGMTGLASGWPGATLVRSDDQGNSYTSVSATNARIKVFIASDVLAGHHGYSIDHDAVLTVTPRYSGHSLSSITEDQFYAHSNLAAYGADGRWEIVAFKTAIDNTGTYTIKDFLRGLCGTEQYTGTHVASDYFIILDTATISFFGLPTNALGAARLYRAITQGAALDSAADITDTYDGVNLKPLSPVDLNGSRDYSTFDWTLTVQRRSRWPVEVFSGMAVPIGETGESYEIEIWDATYSTLKRVLTSSSNAIQYTAAHQISDFSVEQSTVYLKWYQVASAIGRGYPLVSSINRYAPIDPYQSFTKLLLHMNSSALTDEFGHAVTKGGNADYSSVQYKWAPGSAYFDGTGDYLRLNDSTDWTLSDDFVIEAWIYPTSLSIDRVVISHWYSGTASNCAFILGVLSTGKLIFGCGIGGVNLNITGTSLTVSINTWTHIAVSRSGSTVRLFKDGIMDATTGTVSGALNNCPDGLGIGCTSVDRTTSNYFVGYIDDLRFTNGSARGYTTNFTPPATQFPDP